MPRPQSSKKYEHPPRVWEAQTATRDDYSKEVGSWETAICATCELPFPRKAAYSKLCATCFKIEKGYAFLVGDLACLWTQERLQETLVELDKALATIDNVKAALKKAQEHPPVLPPGQLPIQSLLKLCHPDLHKNSELSTEITKQLLALRGKRA